MILRESETFQPKQKYDTLRLYKFTDDLVKIAKAIEVGRILNRDTCAADPQRMPPPAIEAYFTKSFMTPEVVKMEVIKDVSSYPMIKAVNRAVESRLI